MYESRKPSAAYWRPPHLIYGFVPTPTETPVHIDAFLNSLEMNAHEYSRYDPLSNEEEKWPLG